MENSKNLVNYLSEHQARDDHPDFRAGDTVSVHIKIKEGNKERIQIFEGFILKRSKRIGNDATFTVRKISYGIGVEKTFFFNSPMITKIEILKRGKVRQSRIFYMRELKGKSARIKNKLISKNKKQNSSTSKKTAKAS